MESVLILAALFVSPWVRVAITSCVTGSEMLQKWWPLLFALLVKLVSDPEEDRLFL